MPDDVSMTTARLMNCAGMRASGPTCYLNACWGAAFAFLLCLVAPPLRAQAPKDISKDYKDACDRLMCQCGCNEQLSVCAMQNCESATPMRAEIRERLLKGESVDAIVNSFVARYGKQVLSAPTLQGFDITAWIMPFLIFCLGTVVVGWIVMRMVRPLPAAEQTPVPVDPRVERELKDFEEES